jgi:hypothetical protein
VHAVNDIDRKRNAAIQMQIGEDDDQSPITEMLPIGGWLHVLKEGGIYVTATADHIDPGRSNPAIPNTQQRVLSVGTDNVLVQRILLQARELLKPPFLRDGIDRDCGMVLALDFLKDLVALNEQATNLEQTIERLNGAFESDRTGGSSLRIPAVGDIGARCDGFIQGADHALRTLWQLVALFYPSVKLTSWPQKLGDHLQATYGADDDFTKYVQAGSRFLRFVRNTRNAVEHPTATQRVVVTDYALDAAGKVHLPEIEVLHAETPQAPVPVTALMRAIVDSLTAVFQDLLAHMCEKNVQPFAGSPMHLVELPADRRRYKEARYGYAAELGGRLVPAG